MGFRPTKRCSDAEIEDLIGQIGSMSVAGLRSFWEARWERAPTCRSVWMYRRITAWRLQSEHHGGFDHWTALQLQKRSMPRGASPPVGSVVSREYQGKLHQVEVVKHGFRYRDEVFQNLSDVAERITGTYWNGPRFFGLRKS